MPGLYTRANTFPSYYHPDEEGKAKQAMRGRRNFNHPQLLVEVTQLAVGVCNANSDLQAATEVGRWASAGFAAAAVVVLGLVGFRVAGLVGFLLAATAVALSPSLLLYAHYLKEDTALVFGLTLVVLAGRWLADAAPPHATRAVVALGVACGVAASAKYIGVVALGFALPLLWAWRRRLPPAAWKGFAVAFVVTVLLINLRAIGHIGTWGHKMGQQVAEGVAEHKGLTMRRPTGYFFRGAGAGDAVAGAGRRGGGGAVRSGDVEATVGVGGRRRPVPPRLPRPALVLVLRRTTVTCCRWWLMHTCWPRWGWRGSCAA